MKIKIMQFIHGMTMGGAETLVKDYCMLLDHEKFDIVLLCINRNNMPYERILEDHGIRVIYLSDKIEKYVRRDCGIPGKIWRRWLRYYYSRKVIREEKPDVIHTHLPINRYVLFANPSRNTKIVHTSHNEVSILWNKSLCRRIEAISLFLLIKKYPFRFIALHDRMQKELNEKFHVNNTVVVNNGIDFTKFDHADTKENVRNRLGISQDAFVIGHIGRFDISQKNQLFLLDVFSEVMKRNPKASLLMIGSGPDQQLIQNRIQELGLEKNCTILSNRTDIPDLLSAMDAFVFPSFFEGLSVVMIEVQKMRLPCYVSDTVSKSTAISNLVQWCSLQDSAEVWAEKILSQKKILPVYDHLENWDMKNVVRKLEEIYEEN